VLQGFILEVEFDLVSVFVSRGAVVADHIEENSNCALRDGLGLKRL
jgi:hypothetical protein